MGLIGKTMGLNIKIRWGYKNMNGANLPVFFSQVNGANPTGKSTFSCRLKMLSTFNVSAHIYTNTKQHYQLKKQQILKF